MVSPGREVLATALAYASTRRSSQTRSRSSMWSIVEPGLIAGRRGEGVALDRQHPEPEPLVEPQIANVGGCGRDNERGSPFVASQGDGRRDQRAADAAAPVRRRRHGHVLDLGLRRPRRLRHLEVADNLVAVEGDENAAGVDVRVELLRRVLGELEKRPQRRPGASVLLDGDRGDTRSAHDVLARLRSVLDARLLRAFHAGADVLVGHACRSSSTGTMARSRGRDGAPRRASPGVRAGGRRGRGNTRRRPASSR